MSLFDPAPVLVQPYFGWRSTDRLTISGRALRRRRTATFEKTGRVRAMRTMIEQFASREVAGLEVRLELKGPDGTVIERRAVSDGEGYVHFDVALDPHWPLEADPAWEIALMHWVAPEGPQCAEAYVLAPGTVTKLAVISDIDDTIVETGITGGPRAILRNWRRVVAQLPAERIAVPGADGFYGAIGGGAVVVAPEATDKDRAGAHFAATHRPFFYVSSSPWNLFQYLVAFQQSRNLPLGPLLLRDWGLNRATFGSASHGDHKRGALDRLLSFYPAMRFALIGDDTQGDLPAYAATVEANPGRIAAVFIRTGAGPLSPEELAGKAAIEAAGVPLWLGDDFATGAEFLRANGISTAGETAQIVKTVQTKEPEA
ncbi:phosphatase domain-containing protein [Tsuneonella amylolytica]|uniref:phosphatase domain-containing protein n=1 Tax=Tsuneonella amylolytica TaxID=2338327 RepID=UPI000EA9763D|nr:phosphatase domain-containing protein [Tsuneonella amylolytica]